VSVSRARATLAGIRARRGAEAALVGHEAYDAADVMASEVAAWQPFREHPDRELGYAREGITGRARDLARNNGYAAGAVQKEVDAVVGAQFRPSVKPDWRVLGIDEAAARDVGDQIEAAWRLWADDPRFTADVTRTHTFGGLAGLAYRTGIVDGEALAVLHWRDDAPGTFRTAVRIVDPDLLSNPQLAPDTSVMRSGVELDRYGAPVAYHFRRDHETAFWPGGESQIWDRVERETPWGRPQVVHFFDRHRDGQTRGVSRFSSVMDALKMQDKYSRVELQAAVLSAILGLFVTSQFDGETVMGLLDDQKFETLHEARSAINSDLTFGGVRIPVLPPGDTINSVAVSRPAGQFEMFESAVLRRIAAGLGVSYEQLTMDWSKVNYSSARAALVEIWRGFTARRQDFAARFCAPILFAVIEEAVDLGLVVLPAGAPGFHDAPGAWLKAKWIGPGRGYVDPIKEAQAAAIRVGLGLSTMEIEAAELNGADYGDNLDQIRREIRQMPAGVMHPAQEKFATLMRVDGPNMGTDQPAGAPDEDDA